MNSQYMSADDIPKTGSIKKKVWLSEKIIVILEHIFILHAIIIFWEPSNKVQNNTKI